MKTTCILCGRKAYGKSLRFLKPPGNDIRRARWDEACGFKLKPKASICHLHFKESDFIEAPSDGKRARLMPNAVPNPGIVWHGGILKADVGAFEEDDRLAIKMDINQLKEQIDVPNEIKEATNLRLVRIDEPSNEKLDRRMSELAQVLFSEPTLWSGMRRKENSSTQTLESCLFQQSELEILRSQIDALKSENAELRLENTSLYILPKTMERELTHLKLEVAKLRRDNEELARLTVEQF